MKNMLIIVAAVGTLIGGANAEIIIDNWNLSASSLSFTFTGSIDPDDTAGPVFPNVFYIGDGSGLNVSWMNWSTINESFSRLAGDDGLVYEVYGDNDDINGHWISVRVNDYPKPIITSSDYFNISVSVSGTFNPTAINAEDIRVALGFEDDGNQPIFPDADHIVGGTIPEPASLSLIAMFTAGIYFVRRLFA